MARVVGSPEEADKFAILLSSVAQQMKDGVHRLQSGMNHLSEDWKDENFHLFKEKFGDATRSIQVFLVEAEKQQRYLRTRAEKLRGADDYKPF